MDETRNNFKKYALVIGGIILFGLAIWGLEQLASQDEKLFATNDTQTTEADTKVKGNAQASVDLVEYSDFQCPACAAYAPLVQKLSEEFPDTLKIVYRYYPLTTIHKNALISAKAAEAAHRQGKFWEMHNQLFEHQKDWAEMSDPAETFRSYAQTIGLNMDQFSIDVQDEAITDRIKSDQKLGDAADIPGTPTFFLNGKQVESIQNYEDFKRLIENAISKK